MRCDVILLRRWIIGCFFHSPHEYTSRDYALRPINAHFRSTLLSWIHKLGRQKNISSGSATCWPVDEWSLLICAKLVVRIKVKVAIPVLLDRKHNTCKGRKGDKGVLSKEFKHWTRKPCCRRETARCRCKLWSISTANWAKAEWMRNWKYHLTCSGAGTALLRIMNIQAIQSQPKSYISGSVERR